MIKVAVAADGNSLVWTDGQGNRQAVDLSLVSTETLRELIKQTNEITDRIKRADAANKALADARAI